MPRRQIQTIATPTVIARYQRMVAIMASDRNASSDGTKLHARPNVALHVIVAAVRALLIDQPRTVGAVHGIGAVERGASGEHRRG